MHLWNVIKKAMTEHPGQTMGEGKAIITYADVVAFSELFASKIKNEKCCVVFCQSEMANALAILACFAAGVTAVPISCRYGDKHCKRIIEYISPTAIITQTEDKFNVIRCEFGNFELSEQPAVIMCTSGTTGSPKGVMLSEENLLTNVKDILKYMTLQKNDNILISRPLQHSAVLTGELLVSLLSGLNINFYSGTFNPYSLLNVINEKEIDVFCGTPTIIKTIMKADKKHKSCRLKVLCISGECMSYEVGDTIGKFFLKTKIYHVYGLTEAGPRVAFLSPDKFLTYPDFVGIPLQSVEIKIVDSLGKKVETNEVGELLVKGNNVMMGYFKESQKTNEVLVNGWLHTGDLASISDNGLIKIKGRKDDLIIRAGINIYPQEIEEILKMDSRTKAVYVYGITDKNGDTQIAVDVVGDFKNKRDVKMMCVQNLLEYQIPSVINIVDTLEISVNGKTLRKKQKRESYFMQTLRHYPCSISDFGLCKSDDGTYYREEDQSNWISKPLYDLGYGRENGFCKLPMLDFEKLIVLAFDDNVDHSDIVCVMNNWGAISVLADDYYEKTKEYIVRMAKQDQNFRKKYEDIIDYIETNAGRDDSEFGRKI